MKCAECGKEIKTVRRNHQYVESGLPNVVLVDLEFRVCPSCGEEEMVIPRLAQLHRCIAKRVAEKDSRLTGAEVRFLRKHLGWSGEDFAKAMDVTPTTVSRWENDREPMSTMAERLLRLYALRTSPIEEYPNERVAEAGLKAPTPVHLLLEPNARGWKVKEAA